MGRAFGFLEIMTCDDVASDELPIAWRDERRRGLGVERRRSAAVAGGLSREHAGEWKAGRADWGDQVIQRG